MSRERQMWVACLLSLSYASNALVYSPVRTIRQAPACSLLGSSRLTRRAVTMRGARDDDFDDDDDGGMAGEELEIMIWIEDPKKPKGAIRCYMESSTELEGNRYALAHPVDIPVIIATCEDEEEGLHALEADADIDKVFDIAKKVLAEEGFDLKRTPFMLTVEEDEAAFDLDDVEEEEIGNFDDGDDYDEEDVEEGAEVLAKFFHAGLQYYVAEPLAPTFIIARQVSGTRFTLLDDDEMERVKPVLERNFIELNEAFSEPADYAESD